MAVTVDGLVAEACERTGLDDFGGESFRTGLGVLVDSIRREARVSTEAEPIVWGRITHLLANRLRVEDWYRRHPEIDDQEIAGPVWVVGLPRTGTTALSNLLVCDPQTRFLRTWESGAPTPPPETATEGSDPRIAAAEAGLDAMDQVIPEFKTLYEAYATGPTENQDLLGMEFVAIQFGGTIHIPSYEQWLLEADWEPAFAYLRRVLKLLQWRRPPNRWHLKSPGDMVAADALRRVFPDARLVWSHRDPARVLGSVCSLLATLTRVFSDDLDPIAIGERQLRLWSGVVEQAMRHRDEHPEMFVDVHFADLGADPLATVDRLYADVGLPFTPAARDAMAAWTAGHPRGRHGVHSYGLDEWGLDAASVREAFAGYMAAFGVPPED